MLSWPVMSAPVAVIGCNPYLHPTRFIQISNGGATSVESCTASWDLHEVEFYDRNGNKLVVTAHSITETTEPHVASNVVDGDKSTYWAGNDEHGLSCSCWNSSKINKQAIQFVLPETYISRIEVYQGNNARSMGHFRVHCAGAGGNYRTDDVLEVHGSLDQTTLTFSDAGCFVTGSTAVAASSCGAESGGDGDAGDAGDADGGNGGNGDGGNTPDQANQADGTSLVDGAAPPAVRVWSAVVALLLTLG